MNKQLHEEAMTNNQINDVKLLRFLCPPDEYFDFLRQIEEKRGSCSKWTMWQAYELGLMHGKRSERARRAQR